MQACGTEGFSVTPTPNLVLQPDSPASLPLVCCQQQSSGVCITCNERFFGDWLVPGWPRKSNPCRAHPAFSLAPQNVVSPFLLSLAWLRSLLYAARARGRPGNAGRQESPAGGQPHRHILQEQARQGLGAEHPPRSRRPRRRHGKRAGGPGAPRVLKHGTETLSRWRPRKPLF